MVGQIYTTDMQSNKAKSFNTEAPFLDLTLSITTAVRSDVVVLLLLKSVWSLFCYSVLCVLLDLQPS